MALPALAQTTDVPVLARIELVAARHECGLPVSAHLKDAAGREYLLVVATESAIERTSWPYRVLDRNALPEEYVLALPRRTTARTATRNGFHVVYDDGVQWVVRAGPEETDALALLGFDLRRLSASPRTRSPTPPVGRTYLSWTGTLTHDPLVARIMNSVQQANLYTLLEKVTGMEHSIVDRAFYLISSRHTASGTPVQKAVHYTASRMEALGLDVRYEDWDAGGRTGQNVVATRTGGALSNEIVALVAHLDNMPSSGTAPGADDNASGSVAVATAARLLRPYHFDRTLRFILVTGEEQGLLGSGVNAQRASQAGDDIVAVVNLDMTGWDNTGGPTLRLHTRPTSDPVGYANDMELATVFTNVVATYGLSTELTPILDPDGVPYSDHDSYWDYGYPAILAIEDDVSDFNAYYHTSNDSLANLNMPYYTAFVKACLGTVAHLAGVAGTAPFNLIQVANSDWSPGSGTAPGMLYAGHEAGATESGADPHDVAWSNAPAEPQGLVIKTQPYGVALARDARPLDSETLFRAELVAADATGLGVTCTNRLRFTFLAPPEIDRIYTLRVHVDGQYTADTNDFDHVGNLRDIVGESGTGHLNLPALSGVSSGTVYGTCDIGARHLDMEVSNTMLAISFTGKVFRLSAQAQVGARVVDRVEVGTNLTEDAGAWVFLDSFTNRVTPDATNFENGWDHLSFELDTSSNPSAPATFFRVKRTWLD